MELIIPTTLTEIPLSYFVKWEQSEKSEIDLIQIFCNIPDAKKIPISEYKEIVLLLSDVLNSNPELVKTFKYKDIDFGFIPKLDSITGGEFIDLENYMKEPETWHKAMSILYRPITTRKKNWFDKSDHDFYDIESYTEAHDFFIDAPAEYYLGATVFFYNLGNDLLNAMTDYSQKILKKHQQSKAISIRSGVGSLALEP
jgi:hypothetical protein